MRKWTKRLLALIGAVALVFLVLVCALISYVLYEGAPAVVQTVEVPSANSQFVLVTSSSAGQDQDWTVYRQPLGHRGRPDTKDTSESSGRLFWNYDEASEHSDGARLDVVRNRYLVFSRGGFRHSLYDIVADTVLVNEPSPFGAFVESTTIQPSMSMEEEMSKFDEWIRANLDSRIGALLRSAA